MRWTTVVSAAVAVTWLVASGPAGAATPAAEQAFIAAYKAAFTAKDKNGIAALVHTEGANPTILDFYLSGLIADLGNGDVTLEFKDLTRDDIAEAAQAMVGPGGVSVKLSPAPYKKLVISVAIKNANSVTTNTTTVYVADEGDKVRIAAPANVK